MLGIFATKPYTHPTFLLHALASPLTDICLNCDLLVNHQLTPEETQCCLNNLQHQHHYLRQIMTERFGGQQVHFRVLAAIEEVVMRNHRPFAGCLVSCTTQLSPDATLFGGRLVFQEMLSCLIQNGLESYPANSESKQVTISVIQVEQNLIIRVADAGRGWSRLDRWRTILLRKSQKHLGAGCGWSFCQKIIQQHRGRLTVLSKSGKGTTVTLHLQASSQNL